ncbi:hypothetical protein PORY_001648 [Pneumocystis oryctolagi]|uniref:Uncharacterized protein n=1 Tax=Pneumocystis oryctolagi TaxID=42067 RepID=A0ACB7CDF7_9ASCO|nr:hypothetical protein PORY_001648 [Pneumocystis oryctolagi]
MTIQTTKPNEYTIIDLTQNSSSDSSDNYSTLKIPSEENSSTSIHSDKVSSGSGLAGVCCAICLEAPTDLSATPCGHLFCLACIQRALGHSTCPVCRQRVRRHRILPLEVMLAPNKEE